MSAPGGLVVVNGVHRPGVLFGSENLLASEERRHIAEIERPEHIRPSASLPADAGFVSAGGANRHSAPSYSFCVSVGATVRAGLRTDRQKLRHLRQANGSKPGRQFRAPGRSLLPSDDPERPGRRWSSMKLVHQFRAASKEIPDSPMNLLEAGPRRPPFCFSRFQKT